ncbi:C40 family peptidase [Gryllotalpicola ginsengisoli]|uniref:C40 family peptidase n=1 Tax=Gryllotalpicola ginsengisoli TaxID=444608 RepID=UPI0003B538F5|nr:C40 family peptidase [Gryllotalpicola ginsengisoli]
MFANAFVLLAAGGIVATIAIPAYAMNPSTQGQGSFGPTVIDSLKKTDAQSVSIDRTAAHPKSTQDAFGATSTAQIAAAEQAAEQAKQQAAAVAAAKAAAKTVATYQASYTGPSAADYLSNPDHPAFSLASVFATAKKYIGTPYQLGGSTPAGFDCSGYVMFVYAQFGVSLPHSSSAQGQIGQTISVDAAEPGDVIALDDGSHVGFYAGRDADGNVLILDAPKPGGSVSIRPMWTSAYHIQRYGI